MNNPYAETFRSLSGDPTERTKLMLVQYGKEWGLSEDWIKQLSQDALNTAEDIIEALRILVDDPASSPELRQGILALRSGTLKLRREAAGLTEVSEKDDSWRKAS